MTKVVKSTIYAASILREIGGDTAYWLEQIQELGEEQAVANMIAAYAKFSPAEHSANLRNLHEEITKALIDLNEPFSAASPTQPLSAS